METVLITGGSGLIGRHLIPVLLQKGYAVRTLSRTKKAVKNTQVFQWNIDEDFLEDGALENVDHIIHLAGYNVSEGRWNSKRKQQMEDSRIKAISLLKSNLTSYPLRTFISASGVSIYGVITSDKIFEESHPIKNEPDDYLAILSEKWEAAAAQFRDHSNRIVILRTPVVLSKTEGALAKISAPVRKGLGAALGTGKQWMPWVHIDDIVNAYLHAIETPEMAGTYNVCAPDSATNKEFTLAIGKQLNKKVWMPNVPGFAVKLVFGEMSGIVLNGSRVDGKKITQTGFNYKYPVLKPALKNLL